MRDLPGRMTIALIALWACVAVVPAAAAPIDNYMRTAGGLTIYLGIVPAAITKRHPSTHEEAEMHGGASKDAHLFHVMVAVFDAKTGKRIEDAVVTALVSGLGLAGTKMVLEPMRIADTTTFGNYFDFAGSSRYRVAVEVRRPGRTAPVKVEFPYVHPVR